VLDHDEPLLLVCSVVVKALPELAHATATEALVAVMLETVIELIPAGYVVADTTDELLEPILLDAVAL
jgi:hypothetical protein